MTPPDPSTSSPGWTRDYFDDAPTERTRHRLTRRELDELCYYVGLLHFGDRWPPPVLEPDDAAGPFGLATVTTSLGPIFVQHFRARPAGTRDVAVFFAALEDLRRVRIVNVIDGRRLRSARERALIADAAALRASLALGAA